MVRRYEPTKSEVLQAATAAIATLGRLGYKSCLVGGVACALYGNSRVPGVSNIAVLPITRTEDSVNIGRRSRRSDLWNLAREP